MKGEIACQVKAYNKLKTTALELPTNVNLFLDFNQLFVSAHMNSATYTKEPFLTKKIFRV